MRDTKTVVESRFNAAAAGADSQPENAVAPEQIVEQLRAVRTSIVAAGLTPAEKRKIERQLTSSTDVLQAQINMIGAADVVAAAVGAPAADVQTLAEASNRWTAVEDELRGMLAGVEAANLLRRQTLHAITARASVIGAQLAKDPKHAPVLVPHVLEIRRLKRLARRKKAAPQTPSSPAPASEHGTTAE
jgi:hypothetical protein